MRSTNYGDLYTYIHGGDFLEVYGVSKEKYS